MGFISEVIEGFINGIYKIFKHRNKEIGGWERLHPNQVPNWVERAGHKFHNKHRVKHHDLRRLFKGDHYLYRVYFRKGAYGRVKEEYWRKKRR